VSSDRTNTTTERKCTPNQVESSLSILCVPSKRITGVFIGGVSPFECKYYSKPLQRSYSQNIPGLTRNFPITTVSGLQLRRAPLPGATLFATINLDAFSEDSLSFDKRLRHRVDTPIQPLRRIIRRLSCSSLDLRFSPHIVWSSRTLRRPGRRRCPQQAVRCPYLWPFLDVQWWAIDDCGTDQMEILLSCCFSNLQRDRTFIFVLYGPWF